VRHDTITKQPVAIFLYISKVLNIYDHMFMREIWKNIVVEFALLLFILFVTYNILAWSNLFGHILCLT